MTKKAVPTSQRIVESLSALIEKIETGGKLPSEPALASSLGVSRATLREAMRTFETQGLIRRRQGSGTFVMRPKHVIETGLEMLESIGTMAERIGLEVSMGEFKFDQRPAQPDEIQALSLSEGSQVISLQRVIYAEGRPVAFLIDTVPVDILHSNDLGPDFSGSVLDYFLKRSGIKLVSSRCDINAVQADHNVARAMGIQRGDVLLQFVANLYDDNGRVIDKSYSYFLPGYFRFHVVRRVG